MNIHEYETKLINKYQVGYATWENFIRTLAFLEFDAQLEMYQENGWAEQNDGKNLGDISVEDVEAILDDFIERFEDEGQWFRERMMRNAIQDVTNLIC